MATKDVKVKGSLIVAFVALVLAIVALATNYWTQYTDTNTRMTVSKGLWRQCFCNTEICFCEDVVGHNWIKGTQGVICLAVIFNLIAVIILSVLAFTSDPPIQRLGKVTVLTLGLSVVCNVVGVALYAAKTQDSFSYSGGLAIGAAFFELFALFVSTKID